MNSVEREQMIDALGEALCWLHENGNRHGSPSVQRTGEDIVCSVDGTAYGADVLGNIGSIEDIVGPDWDVELNTKNTRAIARRLYECAEAWVDGFGSDALENARMEEEEN